MNSYWRNKTTGVEFCRQATRNLLKKQLEFVVAQSPIDSTLLREILCRMVVEAHPKSKMDQEAEKELAMVLHWVVKSQNELCFKEAVVHHKSGWSTDIVEDLIRFTEGLLVEKPKPTKPRVKPDSEKPKKKRKQLTELMLEKAEAEKEGLTN